jgi:hypothetical protein
MVITNEEQKKKRKRSGDEVPSKNNVSVYDDITSPLLSFLSREMAEGHT